MSARSRLIRGAAALVGLVIGLLGWAAAPASAGEPSYKLVHAYTYNNPAYDQPSNDTAQERGPPVAGVHSGVPAGQRDVNHRSHSTSACPMATTLGARSTYTDHTRLAEPDSDAGTTGDGVRVTGGRFSSLSPSQVAAKNADNVVLGHYPEYVDLAKATGGRTFQVPKSVWDKMSPAEQWGANQKFLDRAIARGSNVQLATPANAAREGSYFERELQYMQSRGYTVGPDGMSLIAPGGP